MDAVLQKCCEQRLKRMILIVPWWPSRTYFGNLQVRLLIIQSRFLTVVVQAMLLECWRIRYAKDQLLDLASGELVSNKNGNTNFHLIACLVTGRLDREQGAQVSEDAMQLIETS